MAHYAGLMVHLTDAEQLANRIEAARTAKGMSLRELSDTSGVPYSTLRRKLQNPPHAFDLPELTQLAVALDAELTIGFAA